MKFAISVVMPLFNSSAHVGRAIQSLALQTFVNFELIVVDDGSTDDSVAIVTKTIAETGLKSRTRVLCHDCNRGCAAARKTGMRAAIGEYMIHVDADDYVESTYLESLYSQAMTTGADVVICDMVREWPSGKKEKLSTPQGKAVDEYLALSLSGELYCSLCNKLIRRSVFVDNDIWPIDGLNMLDDKSVLVRVLYFAKSVSTVPRVLYHYDKNASKVTTDAISVHLDAVKSYHECVASFFESRQLSKQCQLAMLKYKLLSIALKVIHSHDNLDKSEIMLLQKSTISDIWQNPVAPLHYKIALTSEKYGINFVTRLVLLLSKIKKR